MSYNVYFVEDEYMLREFIKSSKIWKAGAYTLCGDASNGEDAWADIQSLPVDILITDIKMPFMDGLELSRLVRAQRPEIKVIILSGYDEFAYAKQALALGVTDYLLKPLKPDDLLRTLARAAEMIDEERRQRQSLSALREIASESLELSQHKFLSQLCNGFLPQTVIASKLEQLHLVMQAPCYTVCILSIRGLGRVETDDEGYLTFLDCSQALRAFTRERGDCFWFSDGINQFRLIILAEGDAAVLEKADGYCKELLRRLEQYVEPPSASAIIGTPCGHLSDLYHSMLSAQVTLGLQPQPPERQVSLASDCKRPLSNMQYTSSEKELFHNLLTTGSLRDVPGFAASMVEKLEQEHMSQLYLTYVCLDILTAVSDFLKSLGCDASAIPDLSIPTVIQRFDSGQNLSGFQNALQELATQAITLRDQCKGGRDGNIVARAKAFMRQHYTESELDLTDVASRVNVNPTYLSTLFKQETGQCFIEYLTFLRIARAKELLKTTQKRTSDIAFDVGYNDQNYFSKLFKKCTGLSAREFRQS